MKLREKESKRPDRRHLPWLQILREADPRRDIKKKQEHLYHLTDEGESLGDQDGKEENQHGLMPIKLTNIP